MSAVRNSSQAKFFLHIVAFEASHSACCPKEGWAHLQTASSQQRAKRSTHLHLVAGLGMPYTEVLGLYVLENVDTQFVALS